MTYDEFREVLDDAGETPCMAWPDAFFLDDDSSARAGDYRVAKGLCRSCPIRFECAEYAVSNNEPYGVWGGLTPRERGGISNGRHA